MFGSDSTRVEIDSALKNTSNHEESHETHNWIEPSLHQRYMYASDALSCANSLRIVQQHDSAILFSAAISFVPLKRRKLHTFML
jgi:hypothetical protein